MSNSENVTAGVPQGSNLGPLLFLLYINDLPNCLDFFVPALFADDTNLTARGASASEIQDILEIELNKVHTWLLANKLTLNVKKIEYMLMGFRQRLSQVSADPILSMGSEGIKRVSSTKTLGVAVDECITWSDHVDKVVKKAAKEIECYGGRNIYLTEIRLKPFIMPLFYLILISVFWYGIIVPKHYKTNYKISKIKPVESSQVIAIKLIQILSDLNFLGTH